MLAVDEVAINCLIVVTEVVNMLPGRTMRLRGLNAAMVFVLELP